MKKKLKKKIIKVPIYFEEIKVRVSTKLDKPQHAAYVDLSKGIVIHITYNAPASIIAHEAVHIANYIFKRSGVALDIENDEPYAYLLGWIVGEIGKAVKR